MDANVVLDIFRSATFIMVSLVAVAIVPSLMVGLVVAMFQAATQINEQTLSFFPRLVVTFLSLSAFSPWIATRISEFAIKLITQIPYLVN